MTTSATIIEPQRFRGRSRSAGLSSAFDPIGGVTHSAAFGTNGGGEPGYEAGSPPQNGSPDLIVVRQEVDEQFSFDGGTYRASIVTDNAGRKTVTLHDALGRSYLEIFNALPGVALRN